MLRSPFLCRRSFLTGATSFAALAAGGTRLPAQSFDLATTAPLPAREHFIIRGAYVLSMDAAVGELPRGDVHVRDGRIVAVGASIDASGASVD